MKRLIVLMFLVACAPPRTTTVVDPVTSTPIIFEEPQTSPSANPSPSPSPSATPTECQYPKDPTIKCKKLIFRRKYIKCEL